jgi:hypothetical protein
MDVEKHVNAFISYIGLFNTEYAATKIRGPIMLKKFVYRKKLFPGGAGERLLRHQS